MPRDKWGETPAKDWDSETMAKAIDVVEGRRQREAAAEAARKKREQSSKKREQSKKKK